MTDIPDLMPVNPDPVMIRNAFDHTDLEEAMAHVDQVIRETKVSLDRRSDNGLSFGRESASTGNEMKIK